MTTVTYGDAIELDIQYLKNILNQTIDQNERIKLEKRIALLEDAVVIYHLYQPPRE